MPIPNHCIDCDKIATVTLNNVPYCIKCGLKNQQEENEDNDMVKYFMYREL